MFVLWQVQFLACSPAPLDSSEQHIHYLYAVDKVYNMYVNIHTVIPLLRDHLYWKTTSLERPHFFMQVVFAV